MMDAMCNAAVALAESRHNKRDGGRCKRMCVQCSSVTGQTRAPAGVVDCSMQRIIN